MSKRVILKQQHKPTKTTLFLASPSEEHLQHLIRLARDPDLSKLMGWSPFFELHETAKFVEAISCIALPYSRPSQPVVFGIYLNPEELPIGYGVLKGFNQDLKTAEVGLAVLERQYRTKGYGRLALKRITNYGFEVLNLKLIGAAILASNIGSINMSRKTGFLVKETIRDGWTMPDGSLADMVWMELHPSTVTN